MGAAQAALILAVLAAPAYADECTGRSSHGVPFASCFDMGNRLSLTASTDGIGGALALRHDLTFEDDPDLVWKMAHDMLDASYEPLSQRLDGVVYRGYFLRHSRDGHILLPLGMPKKVFLPFDIGGLFEIGRIESRPGSQRLGIVETAALIDLARSRDFHRRFALGPAASWTMQRDPMSTEHEVAPFTTLLADVRIEGDTGRTAIETRGELGLVWHSARGWVPQGRIEAGLERIVLALNDRPVLLYANVRYESATAETIAGVGVRFVLVDRTDPRVSLEK